MNYPLFILTAAIYLSLLIVAETTTIKIDPLSRKFIDEYNRTRIFHGMNAVYKIAPWHPTVEGYDENSTLSAVDAKNLKRWGFNVVRLGVMWVGVEPGERGNYNQTYLDQIEIIVDTLAADDISVVLDFHQDIWHRKFCGEGVPDYVYDLCVSSEPDGTSPFPHPSVNENYPIDEDGNPTLDACLSQTFITYYLSAEVGAGFQCLYDNKHDLWSAFGGYWEAVATRFSKKENVLGYELINEPWAGDIYESPKRLLEPGYTEKQYLQPLYEYLHGIIRKVDDEKIIFFEGLTIDYWQNGFTQGPGGTAYNDRQALAYHIYCPFAEPSTVAVELVCKAVDEEFFSRREKDSERLGTGLLMTEFGATKDVLGDLISLERVASLADKHQQSWVYWQLKYYQDLTTMTPQGETLYNEDGTICQDKLRILSRTYPYATAGVLQDYMYDYKTGKFTMQYTLPSSARGWDREKVDESATSYIYLNSALAYPNGFHLTLTGAGADSVTAMCPGKGEHALKLVQVGREGGEVSVLVERCGEVGDCMCR